MLESDCGVKSSDMSRFRPSLPPPDYKLSKFLLLLRRITVGDHDECLPSLLGKVNKAIAGSEIVILAEGGHMTLVEVEPKSITRRHAEASNKPCLR
jgi:hypothetical protein